MRKVTFAPGEFYHLYGRGNNKQDIFRDDKDRIRFLFQILYMQSLIAFPQMGRRVVKFMKEGVFGVDSQVCEKIVSDRALSLVAFTLMPNHYHLLVEEKEEAGISRYMQKILNGYTKYFNTRYEQSGHLFQGPFQAVHVADNEQLLHLSAYIHRNPRDLAGWKGKEDRYPWSSYQDYVKENRWNMLLDQSILLDQFRPAKEYHQFIKASPAKD